MDNRRNHPLWKDLDKLFLMGQGPLEDRLTEMARNKEVVRETQGWLHHGYRTPPDTSDISTKRMLYYSLTLMKGPFTTKKVWSKGARISEIYDKRAMNDWLSEEEDVNPTYDWGDVEYLSDHPLWKKIDRNFSRDKEKYERALESIPEVKKLNGKWVVVAPLPHWGDIR